ncbi:hypothetical protein ACJJTC_003437 [Scirpophaga incertulas]
MTEFFGPWSEDKGENGEEDEIETVETVETVTTTTTTKRNRSAPTPFVLESSFVLFEAKQSVTACMNLLSVYGVASNVGSQPRLAVYQQPAFQMRAVKPSIE